MSFVNFEIKIPNTSAGNGGKDDTILQQNTKVTWRKGLYFPSENNVLVVRKGTRHNQSRLKVIQYIYTIQE